MPDIPTFARRLAAAAAVVTAAALGSGCASAPTPADYATQQPAMDFRAYFTGPVKAHGLFTDRSGRVLKRFTVDLVGKWNGQTGVLEEDFVYSDGTKERRVWQLVDLGGGRFECVARAAASLPLQPPKAALANAPEGLGVCGNARAAAPWYNKAAFVVETADAARAGAIPRTGRYAWVDVDQPGSNLLKALLEHPFDVDASAGGGGGMMMMAPGAAAGGDAAAPAEEKTEFDIVLESFPADKKIAVLKVVRTITGLGLKEAKEMVEAAPKAIKEAAGKEEAEQAKKDLEEAGAVCALK